MTFGSGFSRFRNEESRCCARRRGERGRGVAEQEPGYLAQLSETAEAVAARTGTRHDRWQFCWQSAGHEPGEWMKPDFADLMPELAAAGRRSVVVAPVQFLADHLEILYDVDIGAREQAERNGLSFHRIESLNAHPDFVAAQAAVSQHSAHPVASAASTEWAVGSPAD